MRPGYPSWLLIRPKENVATKRFLLSRVERRDHRKTFSDVICSHYGLQQATRSGFSDGGMPSRRQGSVLRKRRFLVWSNAVCSAGIGSQYGCKKSVVQVRNSASTAVTLMGYDMWAFPSGYGSITCSTPQKSPPVARPNFTDLLVRY